MATISEFLQSLDRPGLIALKAQVEDEIKRRVPIKIREIYKRCGKADCTCQYGELDDYGHGPYLYATWSHKGKQRQRSLGKKWTTSAMHKLRDKTEPRPYQYAITEKSKTDGQPHALSYEDFYSHYGVYPMDDALGRPRVISVNYDAYSRDYQVWQDGQEIALSEFAHLGIGTMKGLATLRNLLNDGKYLA